MVFDLHNDVLTAKLSKSKLEKTLVEYSMSEHIDKVVLALWTSKLTDSVNTLPELISKLNSDLLSTEKFSFSIEDLHFINSGNMDILSSWKKSYDIIYAALTWNEENALAGGAHSKGRVTTLGKAVIYTLENLDIIVDTAHLNRESFWDVINYSKKPIINSHTCFDGLYNNPRNITNDQIKAIIERDGIIGMTLVPTFLTKKPARVIDVFRHIEYFISRYSYKNLAIGTDFYGNSEYPAKLKCYDDFDALKRTMRLHSYSHEAIDAVFYGNAKRFFQKSI